MTKKQDKNYSLSEKLTSLIQAKPSIVDSDNEDLTTISKITVNENDSDISADELEIPKFRKLNNQLLEEEDAKYLGKGVSRKDLKDSDTDLSEEENENEEEEESEDDSQQSEDNENDEIEDQEEELDDDVKHEAKTSQKDFNFNEKLFSKASSDIEKGKQIKNQLHIWDFLLECRMKFQKSLIASNQLPTSQDFNSFKIKGGVEFQNSVSLTKKSIKKLLNSFLNLQEVLLNQNEEYSSMTTNVDTIKSDDEEIPSDSDEEVIPKKTEKTKLKNFGDFSNEIQKRHKAFELYRNSTIQKWNDKTRIGYISNKNFSAFEQSTLKQIEHVLLDKPRLIKRTQIKRSNYHILGQENDEPATKIPKIGEDLSRSDNKNKVFCKEIFDDDDFYHQLLSELVKRKANDVTDPVQLGRQWMQLQKIRSKMKKTVDTKASKGRKVRYVVHPKLVNFMMPIDNIIHNEESRIELCNSLFGKNKK